jgi:hypothetical protein
MTSKEKLSGVLIYWNALKNWGVISVRDGVNFQKFFVHLSRVDIMEPSVPAVGCVVKFYIDESRPPKRERDYWCSVAVEVYNPPVAPVPLAAKSVQS